MIDIQDVCVIAAKEKYDFIYDGIKEYGFQIMIPYKDTNLLMRICRELWFRLHLPCRSLWINKKLKSLGCKVIIVKDSLLCSELLKYIRGFNPVAKIIIMYLNRVHTTFPVEEARHFADELWSYDEEDCRKYGMRKMGNYYFGVNRVSPNSTPKYDVIYLGRDKGRAEEILGIEKKLQELGLKTYFHISPDRSFLRFKKKFYKPTIPYGEYTRLLENTRALLNIMPDGQKSITPRDMEVIFDQVKGITNNKGIKEFKYYHPDRYFVLGDRCIKEIKSFLQTPFPAVENEELDEMEFDNMILKMINDEVRTVG